MAITPPFPVTAVVGGKEETSEHMTTFSLCYSPQEKGRMKNSTEKYFPEKRRKKAAPKELQRHWQHTSTCSREASTFPPSWGCPHCSSSWFSSFQQDAFFPCSMWGGIQQEVRFTQWTKPEASNRNVDVLLSSRSRLLIWKEIFLESLFHNT